MTQAMKQLRKEFGAAAVSGVSPLLLGNCSHLSDLGTEDLVELSKRACCHLVFRDQTMYRQGDKAECVYLLLDGSIRLEHSDASGSRNGYDVIAPYASFGDVVLLGEEGRRYSATALQDSVIVEIPLEPLIEVLQKNTPQAIAWRGAIMARLHRKEPEHAGTFGWRILDRLSQLFEAA